MNHLRVGVCAPLDDILIAQQLGYDFIEANLSELAVMGEAAYKTAHVLVHEADIKPEVFSYMLPRELSVTGRGVNVQTLHKYLDFSFQRAKQLGAQVIVFASAGARQVPEKWPIDMAWRQLMNFLRILERHAADYGLTVAIEPLNRDECNILTTVSEATLLCSILQLKHVRVLANTYHMAQSREPIESLVLAGPLLSHVHIANAPERTYPNHDDGEALKSLFWALSDANYTGRVSIEAVCEDFEQEAQVAFEAIDKARKTV